jgi:cytochrome c-type biogenesis protein CcmH/NrfG
MSEDTDKEILVHLRELKRVVYAVGLLLFVLAVATFYQGFSRASSQAALSWEQVRSAMGRGNLSAASSMAQTLVNRTPEDYYGHEYLGYIYLASGDVANAAKEYSRAYELFPAEERKKQLDAVRARITGSPPHIQ